MTGTVVTTGRTGYIGSRAAAQLLKTCVHFANLNTVNDTQEPTFKTRLLPLIIPCYDEEEVIAETMQQLKTFCTELVDLGCQTDFRR